MESQSTINASSVQSASPTVFEKRAAEIAEKANELKGEIDQHRVALWGEVGDPIGDPVDLAMHLENREKLQTALSQSRARLEGIEFTILWLQGGVTAIFEEKVGGKFKSVSRAVPAGYCVGCLDEIKLERILECDPPCISYCLKLACQTKKGEDEYRRIRKYRVSN